MRERYKVFDTLKGVSILAVILIHVTANYMDTNEYLPLLLNQLSKFAVPVFFIVSGWGMSVSKNVSNNYLNFLKKQINKLVIPFLFWSVIYFLLDLIILGKQFEILDFLTSLVLGSSYYHMYFIPLLFCFYLIFPIFKKFRQSKVMFLGCLLVTMSSQALGHNGVLFFGLDINLLNWIFYFEFGVWLGYKFIDKRTFIRKYRLVAVFTFLISLLLLYMEWTFVGNITAMRWGILIYTISIITLFIGFNIENQILTNLGQISFNIYLIHPLIIILILKFFEELNLHTNLKILIVWGIVVILSVLYNKFVVDIKSKITNHVTRLR